ncbi:cellulose synthase-like protein H1 [Triticum dicoccoides]|uniref:cellulose synthase-like protein H1 n=1 Tax=Triticum dicoccoides TaxID=85692 RepID=UPI00188F942E|nr:cellulose synthase-like protein H1 [Triticum dicoccoides]
MAGGKKLQERVALGRSAWMLADFVILFLLLALVARRAASLGERGGTWLAALVCEAWFAFVWILNMNGKWSPVRFDTYPDNLSHRMEELPAVDMFVTTADPALEPPLITVNTVLSLLALDYPHVGKLACYVSDDGCSPLTCYALREAAKFASLWVPFCKRHDVGVRAPFMYFSSAPEVDTGTVDHEFLESWALMKSEYEKLASRIENADEVSILRDGGDEFAEFIDAERGNHPTIVKVLWDNSKNKTGEGFPHLVYLSREKSPRHRHNFKAGAMNVLTRVSAVMTNAPIMLNVDCDMFANNPQVALHAMCLLLGFDDEIHSGFVQAPQKFYGGLKDDPFGNQMQVITKKIGGGLAGIQGTFYGGTGCFHRRKVIYGMPPPDTVKHETRGSPSYKELQAKFGSSKELIESSRNIISGDLLARPTVDISSRVEMAKQVGDCNYEAGTCWGQEIGWVYGSMTEDILTGQRIQAAGWESALLDTDPPAFLGCAPTGGPASLTQFKRWATGLLEILISRNSPILGTIFRRLQLRQCLAYLIVNAWPMRAPFEMCYALLGPFCLLTNQSFLPTTSNEGFRIPAALFLSYHVYHLMEYKECGLSVRAWWNNHRMQRITSASAWLLAFLTVILKTLGLSETVFEVTRKESSTSSDGGAGTDEADTGLFTFDSAPVFIPVTALSMLNIVALAVAAWRAVVGTAAGVHGGPGVGEFVCCGWMVLCFWPFMRGLVSSGKYGIPWSVRVKAGLIVAAFVHLCTRN